MNTSEVTLGILLDYSKAFDTIDHLTLLEKLHKLNFSVQALKLIDSFVSERKQFFQVDDKSSSVKLNNFGVQQGRSCPLQPIHCPFGRERHLRFLKICWWFHSTLYKDPKPKNLKKCIKVVESDLETVSLWSSNNSLVFNDDKTMLLHFQLSQT